MLLTGGTKLSSHIPIWSSLVKGQREALLKPGDYTYLPSLPKISIWQVAGAYSKTWSYREDTLLAIYKKMMEMPTSTPKEDLKNLLRAAIFLIVRAIKDIVSSVSKGGGIQLYIGGWVTSPMKALPF